jgi:hypothetical protein
MTSQPEYPERLECGVGDTPLESWEDFAPFINKAHANTPAYIYRGQADADWKIVSTLDRLEKRFPTTKNYLGSNPSHFNCSPATREQHLEAFKEAVRGKRGSNPQALSENEWWALAQHHGLATPLLDWTYSPFVALFFAFEEAHCTNKEGKSYEPEKRAVYAVPVHIISKKDESDPAIPFIFSPRREISYRLSSQSGVLMKMPKGMDLESNVGSRFTDETSETNIHARSILMKITIPNKGRVECLKFLNKMNINRMSLFADLDGAAKYINSLWELDFDTGFGWLPDGSK